MARFIQLASLMFLGLMAGCRSAPQMAAPGPSFRLTTYNVNYGADPQELVATLRGLKTDVLCLQEADGFERTLREGLVEQYLYMLFRRPEERPGGGYGILSRFPVEESAWVPLQDWFGGWICNVTTPIGVAQILNVHLKPPIYRGSWAKGYFLTRGDRLREITKYFAACDSKLPTLVVGDFNDTRRSRAVRYLERAGLRDGLAKFDRRSGTWACQARLIKLRRRIDHILYSDEYECREASVLRTGTSDHFPVTAEFGRAAKKRSPRDSLTRGGEARCGGRRRRLLGSGRRCRG